MISIIEPTLKSLGKATSTNGDTFYGKKKSIQWVSALHMLSKILLLEI